MHKRIYRLLFTAIGLVIGITAMAQQDSTGAEKRPEMAEFMRSNGKIYVVIAVMVTILLGLVLYVARIDRKLTKLEQES